MTSLWIGIITGVLLSAIIQRVRSLDRWYMINCARGMILWAVLYLMLLFLGATVGQDFYSVYQDSLTSNFRQAVRIVLLPFVTGVGLGVWLERVIASQAVRSQNEGSAWRLGAVSAGIMAALLITSESSQKLLSRVQRLTVGGSGVEFTALKPISRTQQASSVRNTTIGVPSVENPVSAAIRLMKETANNIVRDECYNYELFKEPSNQFNTSCDHIEVDGSQYKFAINVLAPIGTLMTDVQGWLKYQSAEMAFQLGLIQVIQSILEPDQESLPDSGSLYEILTKLRTNVCYQAKPLVRKAYLSSSKVEICDAPIEKAAALNAFNQAEPYSAVLVARLLNAAGENHAALSHLEYWLAQNFVDSNTASPKAKLHTYRVRGYAASIAMSSRSQIRSRLSIYQLNQSIRIGDDIIKNSKWSSLTKFFDTQQTQANDMGCGPQRSAFFDFYRTYIDDLNSFVYYASQDPTYTQTLGIEDYVSAKIKELSNTDLTCLIIRARGNPGVIKKIELQRAQIQDTLSSVRILWASQAYTSASQKQHLCLAKSHSDKAIEIALRRQPEPRPRLTKDASKADIAKQWDYEVSQMHSDEDRVYYRDKLSLIRNLLAEISEDCD